MYTHSDCPLLPPPESHHVERQNLMQSFIQMEGKEREIKELRRKYFVPVH